MMIAASLLLFPSLFALQMDETVKDFKRYFRKSKDPIERVEFIRSLEDIDSPDVLKVLLPVLKDKDPNVIRAAEIVIAQLPTPSSRAGFLLPFEKGKPLLQVVAGMKAASTGKWREYMESSRLYLRHKDADVRLWSAVCAGAFLDEAALDDLVALVGEDENPLVRVAAIDALQVIGVGQEDVAAPPLLLALGSENLSVATAACLALQRIRHKEAIPALLNLWETGEGRILQNIYPTLLEITDLQFSDDPAQWRRWWNRAAENYVIPTPEELATRAAARSKAAGQYISKTKSASFAGIDTPSREVVFVVDVSGSMEDLVLQRDKFREAGHKRLTKMEIIKKELESAIEGLGPEVRFNVHSFASNTRSWRKTLMPANALNKKGAIQYVKKLKALGGAAAQARASVGLSGSAGAEEGRTNTWGALLLGLGVGNEKVRRAVTQSASEEVDGVGDTLFFFSDGLPTVGEFVDTVEIRNGIAEINRFRRITIHTVAIGDFKKDWMRMLASENRGQFVDLGR